MARITVEIEDSKATLLKQKADKFGLLPDQFVSATIEDLIAPERDFEAAMHRVLSKNKELYDRLA